MDMRDDIFGGSNEDMRGLLAEKAKELFCLCDKEAKGFITKRDMQRLRQELGMTPDQLEDVYDNLDDNRNGYLTIAEFTDGFGTFLGFEPLPKPRTPELSGNITGDEQKMMNRNESDDEMDDEQFQTLLEHIGANDVFSENSDVKNMWSGMKKENPRLLTHFEEFLGRVTKQMKQNKAEYVNLEEAYKSKTNMYDNQVRKLYEEMENQIGLEKERLLAEENAREAKVREELESELKEKDAILQDIMQKHKIMEDNLCVLNVTEAETKQENIKLQKDKKKLEQKLEESKKILEEMREHTDNLRKNSSEEKRHRARAALQASEGIALERESLVRQLDALKTINQKLMDEKDESITVKSAGMRGERLSDVLDDDSGAPVPKPRRILEKRGSTIGDYLDQPINFDRNWKSPSDRLYSINDDTNEDELTDFDCDYDDSYYGHNASMGRQRELRTSSPPSSLPLQQQEQQYTSYVENNLNVCDSPKVLNSERLRRSASLSDNDNDDIADYKLELTQSDKNTYVAKEDAIKNNMNEDHQREGLISATTTKAAPKALWKIKHGIYPAALEDTDDLDKEDHWKVQKTYHTDKSVLNDDCNISREEGWKVKKNAYFDNPLHDEGTGQIMDTWKVQLMLFPAAMISLQLSEEDDVHSELSEAVMSHQPERVYKVVFVGDSSVGKTSFINRFCKDAFNPHFSATIGVDFQVKQMMVDGRAIALQVWDTAGQERYRSITKQYFRRADGVVVMYDMTSETSFKNVRSWAHSLQDAADEHIVVMIIGNKIDVCLNEDDRIISLKDAERLADEFQALHYEVSAKVGTRVNQSMEALAGLLQEKEDDEIEKVLQLNDVAKKKKCC